MIPSFDTAAEHLDDLACIRDAALRAALLLSDGYWLLIDSDRHIGLSEAEIDTHATTCYDFEQMLNAAFDRLVDCHTALKKAEADFEAATRAEVRKAMKR